MTQTQKDLQDRTMILRLPSELLEKIDALAKVLQSSRSKQVREIIKEHFNNLADRKQQQIEVHRDVIKQTREIAEISVRCLLDGVSAAHFAVTSGEKMGRASKAYLRTLTFACSVALSLWLRTQVLPCNTAHRAPKVP